MRQDVAQAPSAKNRQDRSRPTAPTLSATLQRAHVYVAMIAIGLAGLALTGAGLLAHYVGIVQISARDTEWLTVLLRGLAILAACLVVSALVAIGFSRRMVERLGAPLRELADVAHQVRFSRSLNARVRLSGIAELDELSHDFNALLDEIEQRQLSLQDENAHLAHKASHDGLTGLPNRALFETRLAVALEQARAAGERLAILYVDCNAFKAINDTLGHAAGDRVLIEVARRARRHLRDTDLLARLGGDEFVALIRPVHDVVDAQVLTDDILGSMRKPVVLGTGGARLSVSISIGVALFPIHADTPEALLMAADQAMYRAKQSNRRGASALAELPYGSGV